ncbi:MAG: PucR family transcriptional regulator ligand-binding domain-containing protein [Lachnospiraceae bacterium]|nr:PucR family transcriptional regulator ligand-binding domain-containing protein [Lachnospiraceae bacterium]
MNPIELPILYPNVAELLQLPVFQDCILRSGQAGLNNPIHGFNLSDTPEYYRWLQPHEILITSCFAIHQNPDMLKSFIPTLAQQEISAVFIKPYQYLKIIPDYMLVQSNQYRIPLIELSEDIRFSAITKDISDELMKRQTESLTSALSVNHILTNIIINGAGLDEIAYMISGLSHSSVMILDTVNNLRAITIAPGDSDTLSHLSYDEQAQMLISGSRMHEIQVDNTVFGYLYLYGTDLSTYLPMDILIQILHIIPLEITKTQSLRAARTSELSNFILHLLSDQIIDETWEAARAERLGFPINDFHTVLYLKADHMPGSNESICVFQHSLLLNSISYQFAVLGMETQIIKTAPAYILLLSGPEFCEKDFVRQLSLLTRSFPSTYSALKIRIGCSRPHIGITGIAQGNREAAIAFQAVSNSRQSFLRFEELGLLRFVYSDNPEYEISLFIEETLGELADTSQERNLELLRTLESYLKNQGNLKRVSEELFAHYNTVTYRLKNIQKTLGIDLHDVNDRFSLELALRLFYTVHYPKAFPEPTS